jgi:hypothetical protein
VLNARQEGKEQEEELTRAGRFEQVVEEGAEKEVEEEEVFVFHSGRLFEKVARLRCSGRNGIGVYCGAIEEAGSSDHCRAEREARLF